MSKRCGFINKEIVLMDRTEWQDFDNGTIWTNLADNELCVRMNGEKKLIRVDAGTGADNIQRVVTRVAKDENDNLQIFYIDLTIVDGVITDIGQESSYVAEVEL